MHSSFQGLGRLVNVAAGMAGISLGTRLEAMIIDSRRMSSSWIRQVRNGVTRCTPRLRGGLLVSGQPPRGYLRTPFEDTIRLCDPVAIPIVAKDLVPDQAFLCVAAALRGPTRVNIVAEPNEYHPFPPLRHTKIGGVQKLGHNLVVKPRPGL